MNQGSIRPNYAVPVWETVAETLLFVWKGREVFMSLAFPAIVVLSILNTILAVVLPPVVQNDGGLDSVVYFSPSTLASALIALPAVAYLVICFAVAWHRNYLIRGESSGLWSSLRLRSRHLRFLGYSILLTSLLTVLALTGMTLAVFGPVTLLVTLVLMVAGYARLAFVLPAVAIDETTSFSKSWRITRGNTWRVAAVITAIWSLTILSTLVLGQIIYGIFDQPVSFMGIFVVAFVFRFLSFVTVALMVTALSIMYNQLRGSSFGSLDIKV